MSDMQIRCKNVHFWSKTYISKSTWSPSLKLGEMFLKVLFCRFSSKHFEKIGLSNHDHALSNNQMAVYFGQITTSSGRQMSKHSKNVCKYPSNHDHAHSNSQNGGVFHKDNRV